MKEDLKCVPLELLAETFHQRFDVWGSDITGSVVFMKIRALTWSVFTGCSVFPSGRLRPGSGYQPPPQSF